MLLIGLFAIVLALTSPSVEAQTIAGRARDFSQVDFQLGSVTAGRSGGPLRDVDGIV